jgi:4-alpha-glucanotransferase
VQDKETGKPAHVSGVPPDAFSATGQLWGSPLYNWKAMEKDNYAWWAQRMKRAFNLYDEFRIDHFRGLAGYWSIDAGETTAMNGTWKVRGLFDYGVGCEQCSGKGRWSLAMY